MKQVYCATLAMYDWPETRDAIDSLWQLLQAPLRDAGLEIYDRMLLDRQRELMEIWQDPGLVLGQTCGFPYVQHLRQKTQLIGTPIYSAPGCSEGYYTSWILARTGDTRASLLEFANSVVAINDLGSQSGCNALRLSLSELSLHPLQRDRSGTESAQSGFFSRIVVTGAHRESLRAVAQNRADICAIDPVCLALARKHDPDIVSELKTIGVTPKTPSLPLIMSQQTASQINLDELQTALRSVLDHLPIELQQALHLDGLAQLEDTHYQRITTLSNLANRRNIRLVAED